MCMGLDVHSYVRARSEAAFNHLCMFINKTKIIQSSVVSWPGHPPVYLLKKPPAIRPTKVVLDVALSMSYEMSALSRLIQLKTSAVCTTPNDVKNANKP